MNLRELNEADADVLISLLVDELRAQEGLEVAVTELEESVLAQNLDQLEIRLEGLSPRLGDLEETMRRRERVVERLAKRSGVAAGPGTVRQLTERIPASRRDEVTELYESVRSRGGRVRAANRQLRVIVSDLARMNQGMVRAAFGVDTSGTTYDRRGSAGDSGHLSIMDRRF